MQKKENLYLGHTLLNINKQDISLEKVLLDGEDYYKIKNYDEMPPFFMTIVSDVDLWMFISSFGGLTCGRKNAESSLFPYETDDKIHDSHETTGAHTVFIVHKEDKAYLWTPFSTHHKKVYSLTRNIYKNTLGNKIVFEEINHDLEVSFRYTWKSSDAFGFIKESKVFNLSEKDLGLKVLDGIRNIMPYGMTTHIQSMSSTLADGYKRCELVAEAGLGIYTLSSIMSDKAEPSESLKATTVWSKGLKDPRILLSEQQVANFCENRALETEEDVKGRRGAFYVSDAFKLKSKESMNWHIVAELNQSASKIQALKKNIKENPFILKDLASDVSKGDSNLKRYVHQGDGFQCTAKEKAADRHFSNTLYNLMRGGIYADEYRVEKEDLESFIRSWNKNIYLKHKNFIESLPETFNYTSLLKTIEKLDDPDLERLVMEYLPLTYSRRHGDPSRPWNKFNIEITKENGDKALKFEGNWRDIFQNWEALSISFPNYIESIIAKFVNASTADGYNPYRITKEGIDWETHDPEDPWSNIGYWGDHQIIYLLKLLELSKAYHPEKTMKLLEKEIFVYANVPYRIKGFEALVKDPHHSIDFDGPLEDTIAKRVAEIGSDGKLIYQGDEIYKVNLMEKLLVTFLSKCSNYVPEGGIWMNTQRPEWNDANNALVGNGLSMVTLYYMHRFLIYMEEMVHELDLDSIQVSVEVLEMFNNILKVFEDQEHLLGHEISDQERFVVVKALGEIGETYRQSIYNHGFLGEKKSLSLLKLKAFIKVSKAHLKDTIGKNKREDGLYHAYNLIKFSNESCSISNLYEMLEGQVSVLSSKALDEKEAVDILKALRNSSIYREDQNSYMLYPNRELPKFLHKNVMSEEEVMVSKILKNEIENGWTRFVEKDVHGKYHFNGQYKNADELAKAIEASKTYEASDIEVVKSIFKTLFNHHAFTGRSGTFYKYEGLGCIYWHMVSKLLLATQENFNDLYRRKGMTPQATDLYDAYMAIKEGIGLNKSPEAYGAFPTDAYSHTPGFSGVQQPGMTGQVKEDFVSRLAELGVEVNQGLVAFKPILLSKSEFLKEKRTWSLPSYEAGEDTVNLVLKEGSLGFTFCRVPVIYSLDKKKEIFIEYYDGKKTILENTDTLESSQSLSLFNREHKIKCIHVSMEGAALK